MKKILITGGGGFVAAHFAEYILRHTDWRIVLLDKFRNPPLRLEEIGFGGSRMQMCVANLKQPINPEIEKQIGEVDYIVHLAARTQLSQSIEVPREFIETNVLGTMNILEFARRRKDLTKFIYFSTDEVYGRVTSQPVDETAPYRPSTPYAASKICGVELSLAYANTYNVPVVVTTCMSLIGERQPADKFLPRLVRAGILKSSVAAYFDFDSGDLYTSDFLHAQDTASAVLFLIENGKVMEKYNLGRAIAYSNVELIEAVSQVIGWPIEYILTDPKEIRPGFSVRFGLDCSKLLSMGWTPARFEDSVQRTVRWMIKHENRHWLGIHDA